MILTDEIKNFIKEHSLENPTEESCGLLYKNNDIISPFKVLNIHEDKKHFFKIDPKDYLKVSILGDIIAIYHSHNENGDDNFSDFDIINAENFNIIYILFCIKDNSFKIYHPVGKNLPYINRQYVVGYIDCFSLVQDFYKNEKNISINNFTHPYRFVEDKINHPDNDKERFVYEEFLESQNFKKVENLKKHDIILMRHPQIKSSTHAAIYMDNNLILHQPFKSNSLIEEYKQAFKRLTTKIYRHSTLI